MEPQSLRCEDSVQIRVSGLADRVRSLNAVRKVQNCGSLFSVHEQYDPYFPVDIEKVPRYRKVSAAPHRNEQNGAVSQLRKKDSMRFRLSLKKVISCWLS